MLSLEPLRIACGEGVLEIQAGQLGDNGLYLSGPQLAREAGLWPVPACTARIAAPSAVPGC